MLGQQSLCGHEVTLGCGARILRATDGLLVDRPEGQVTSPRRVIGVLGLGLMAVNFIVGGGIFGLPGWWPHSAELRLCSRTSW